MASHRKRLLYSGLQLHRGCPWHPASPFSPFKPIIRTPQSQFGPTRLLGHRAELATFIGLTHPFYSPTIKRKRKRNRHEGNGIQAHQRKNSKNCVDTSWRSVFLS